MSIKDDAENVQNTNESNQGVSDPDKIKVQPDETPEVPGGIDKAKANSAEKYPEIFKPSCFKMPMNDKRIHERRIMTFEDFLKRINYRTHDGQSDETTQRGHGQNLQGKP